MNHASPLDIMLAHDHFTRWLGLQIDAHGDGMCQLHFTVRQEMLNGFGTIHGGVLFAAADSAFAFACNSHGKLNVALDASINFVRPAKQGEILSVKAVKLHRGNKTGFYDVMITDSAGELIATFHGTAYDTGRDIA